MGRHQTLIRALRHDRGDWLVDAVCGQRISEAVGLLKESRYQRMLHTASDCRAQRLEDVQRPRRLARALPVAGLHQHRSDD
ncbi:hypothetical protein D9M72_618560 [compost metagenome]